MAPLEHSAAGLKTPGWRPQSVFTAADGEIQGSGQKRADKSVRIKMEAIDYAASRKG